MIPAPFRTPTLVLFVGLLVLDLSTLATGDERSHVPLRDSAVEEALRAAEQQFTAEDWEGGIRTLLEAHAEVWSRPNTVALPRREIPCPHHVHVAATRAIVDRLRQLPDAARSVFEARYDLPARVLYERSIREGDVRGLLRCAELYILSPLSREAALAAGDLLYEAGDTARATEAWSLAAGSLGPTRDRGLLGRHWATHPEEVATPQGSPGDDGAPEPVIPSLPFREATLAWEFRWSEDSDGGGSRCLPGFGSDEVAIASPRRMVRLSLESGEILQSEVLPRPREFSGFADTDPRLVRSTLWDPARVLTSYISRANRAERFAGYAITTSIPRRALRTFPTTPGERAWDTTRPRGPHPIVSELSFNSPPLQIGDRIYALAWRQAGYVDGHLVCLDARDGHLIWKTLLVSNQFELTVFGELAEEPLLGEVTFHDGVLFVSTQLGAVAAVRAHDGLVHWLTTYPQLGIPVGHPYYRRSHTSSGWEASPMVVLEDRLLVTPVDASFAMVFERTTGNLLQVASRIHLGERILGRYGDRIASLRDRQRVELCPESDVTAASSRHELSYPATGAPVLVEGGVLYGSRYGLHYHAFEEAEGSEGAELDLYRQPEPSAGSPPRQLGHLSILPDRIIQTDGSGLRCYVERRREEAPVAPVADDDEF